MYLRQELPDAEQILAVACDLEFPRTMVSDRRRTLNEYSAARKIRQQVPDSVRHALGVIVLNGLRGNFQLVGEPQINEMKLLCGTAF